MFCFIDRPTSGNVTIESLKGNLTMENQLGLTYDTLDMYRSLLYFGCHINASREHQIWIRFAQTVLEVEPLEKHTCGGYRYLPQQQSFTEFLDELREKDEEAI